MTAQVSPSSLSNTSNTISKVFDRETDTFWSPTAASSYTVVIKIAQSSIFRGLNYYAYGDGLHDAQTLEVSYSNDAVVWAKSEVGQRFTLKSGISTAQPIYFRNRTFATYWRFVITNNTSSSVPLWLREINMIWSVSSSRTNATRSRNVMSLVCHADCHGRRSRSWSQAHVENRK